MGSLRNLLAALAALTATNAVALPNSPDDLARAFAECAGRYAAVADHARLFDGAASEVAESRRDLFVSLLETTLPDIEAARHDPLNWRIQSKAAHAALLATAVFTMYPDRAKRAQMAADRHIALCSMLILPA